MVNRQFTNKQKKNHKGNFETKKKKTTIMTKQNENNLQKQKAIELSIH